MKATIIFTALLLFFSTITLAQNKEYKEYHNNGKLKTSGYMTLDGKKTGEWKVYYENGKLRQIQNLINDKLEGEFKSYYENGKQESISNFKNDKLEGEAKIYHENSKIKNVMYYKNGDLEGEAKDYYENGSLKAVANYVNGKETSAKFYYQNGQEDNRRKELEDLLKKYLVKKENVISIDKIFAHKCEVRIYYKVKAVADPEWIIIFPTNPKEIDKEGKLQFDSNVAKTGIKINGKYEFIAYNTKSYIDDFTINKDGRKKIEEIMRSLNKNCNE